jgi:hypothetical protein
VLDLPTGTITLLSHSLTLGRSEQLTHFLDKMLSRVYTMTDWSVIVYTRAFHNGFIFLRKAG